MRPPVQTVRLALRLLCAGAVTAPLSFAAPALSQPPGQKIGLVITSWRHALHETPGGKAECPAGLAKDEEAQFRARTDADERLKKYGSLEARGPNGESPRVYPLRVEDPLPFPELQTKIGYGLNLDGSSDGRATANTCQHDKFTSPEGQPVDNQLARVVGCVWGWRTDGFQLEFMAQEFENSPLNRIVVEISGVDDEKNDPRVEVTIAKGRDKLVSTAPKKYVPYLVQRIDDRYPRFIKQTRGRIVDGVLITDPIPVVELPGIWVTNYVERRMRSFQLRLKLIPDGAEGYVAGYEDLKYWWLANAKGAPGLVAKFSYPSYYRAALKYADGDKDPATGQCRAISAAYRVTAVRALIPPRPAQGRAVASSASGRERVAR